VTTKAFILIETVVGKNKEAINEFRQLEGVKSVDIVTGPKGFYLYQRTCGNER